MREQILESIIELKNKKTNDIIPIIKKELKFENGGIWHVFINDSKLMKTSEYTISYKCLSCEKINSVGTTQFLRKIRQCKAQCYQCNIIKLNSLPSSKSLKEYYEESKIEFESYPDQYINSYQLSHLDMDDYNRLKPKIMSLGNGKYNNMDNYEFWPIYKVGNQMKFSSIMYDKIDDIIFKAHQPIVKCDNCEKQWRCKSLESLKKHYKLLCPDCKVCNKTFKLRPVKNINNKIIMYQSKLELKFINWCNSNNIIVNNGPVVDYLFNGKNHKYRIDFQIDDLLIEIKDFHIWHKNQVESGKWAAKLSAVESKKYYFITPNNWNQMISELKNILKIK